MYAFSSKGDLTEIEYEYEGFMSDNQRLNDVGNIISKLKMAFLSNKMTYNDNGFAVILDNGIIAEDIVIFTKCSVFFIVLENVARECEYIMELGAIREEVSPF